MKKIPQALAFEFTINHELMEVLIQFFIDIFIIQFSKEYKDLAAQIKNFILNKGNNLPSDL